MAQPVNTPGLCSLARLWRGDHLGAERFGERQAEPRAGGQGADAQRPQVQPAGERGVLMLSPRLPPTDAGASSESPMVRFRNRIARNLWVLASLAEGARQGYSV
jgi:hypothetical protein